MDIFNKKGVILSLDKLKEKKDLEDKQQKVKAIVDDLEDVLIKHKVNGLDITSIFNRLAESYRLQSLSKFYVTRQDTGEHTEDDAQTKD